MKYYSVNAFGFLKSDNESHTFRMAIFSILNRNKSPTCIEDLTGHDDWQGEQKMFDLIAIRSKYKLNQEENEAEIYKYMLETGKIVEITEIEFNQFQAKSLRFDETAKFISNITIKKSVEIMVDFLKKNDAVINERYGFLGQKVMRDVKTKKYWIDECKHSHSLVHDWIYFDLPNSL